MNLTRPPKLDIGRAALFLDIDGTIAEIADLPWNVRPYAQRTLLLGYLGKVLNGRIAVLTGRTLDETDRILEGAVVSVAAVHGLVRRDSTGRLVSVPPAPSLNEAREELLLLLHKFPNLLLEEKGSSLAIHFRQVPHAADAVYEASARIAKIYGLDIQGGDMVSELRTPGPDKGDSLQAFMNTEPFAGSMPIMVGDDLTDEHAFAAAHALGGYGILVGEPRVTRALYGLGSVEDVMRWLSAGLHDPAHS